MKTGDYILCKKSMCDEFNVFFIRNEKYEIHNIDNNIVYLKNENRYLMSFVISQSNNNKFKLNDYFYTIQEIRKQKLKKINETR